MSRRSRAFGLVEMLVVLVILGLLAAFLLPRYLQGSRTKDGKKIEAPIQRAESTQCAENLRQIRMAYQMATTTSDDRPASLADLRSHGVTDSISRCPVGGEPYQLAAATGQARCPHPGHEAY